MGAQLEAMLWPLECGIFQKCKRGKRKSKATTKKGSTPLLLLLLLFLLLLLLLLLCLLRAHKLNLKLKMWYKVWANKVHRWAPCGGGGWQIKICGSGGGSGNAVKKVLTWSHLSAFMIELIWIFKQEQQKQQTAKRLNATV